MSKMVVIRLLILRSAIAAANTEAELQQSECFPASIVPMVVGWYYVWRHQRECACIAWT